MIETATFQVKPFTGLSQGTPIAPYVIKCHEIAHPVLSHPYLVLEGPFACRGEIWMYPHVEINTRLNELTSVELMKIPAEKRPPHYADLVARRVQANDLRDKFPLPATWTFYDKEVDVFLASVWDGLEKRNEETLNYD